MKTRNGFVSNSSSQSFCIYGWDDNYLRESTGESWNLGSFIEMATKISEKFKDIEFAKSCSPSAESVFGVGNVDYDIDHYNDNWEEYEANSPSKEEMVRLDKIAMEMGLPAPKMFSATWYNG